jgi:acetolactate synthase-1/2/3 large subunit
MELWNALKLQRGRKISVLEKNSSKSGADHFVETLKEHGVDVIFCITGAGNLAIVDALFRDGNIKIVYSHHEQAAVMEAQGYSRISGKLGVALVTTGGGSSNVVTGVLSAYLDSVPVLIVSGNESSFHCENPSGLRAYGVQGFDSVAVLTPITKDSVRVLDGANIKEITNEAIKIATTERMGPTHIDFPMDLQRKAVALEEPKKQNFSNKVSGIEVANISDWTSRLASALSLSQKPVLYIGNGCRESFPLVQDFIEKNQIPYFVSWSAIDLFPESDPLNIGRVGIYGDRASNIILQQADLILTLGTRLAIPQIGYDKKDFGRNALKWIVDIDPTECSKFDGLGWNVINCSVSELIEELQNKDIQAVSNNSDRRAWQKVVTEIWSKLPRIEQVGPRASATSGYLHSADAITLINMRMNSDAIVATDVGAGLLTGHYMYEKAGTQRFFTSQGLGEMGFGLPGAIGAHFGDIKKQIICLNTDGAMMFNLQELQVVREHQIPLKLFVFNNDGYTMIKISQHNLFNSRISGSSSSSGISFPSFEKIASAFELKYVCISNLNQLEKAIEMYFDTPDAVLFEIIMDPDQKYLPRLATSKLEDGTLVSPPLEDLDPLLPIEKLKSLLHGELHENSTRARG